MCPYRLEAKISDKIWSLSKEIRTEYKVLLNQHSCAGGPLATRINSLGSLGELLTLQLLVMFLFHGPTLDGVAFNWRPCKHDYAFCSLPCATFFYGQFHAASWPRGCATSEIIMWWHCPQVANPSIRFIVPAILLFASNTKPALPTSHAQASS